MPFLVMETGQPVALMRRHGSFAHWIRVAAGLQRDEAVVVDVERGDPLPSREGFAGAIVTGSAAMVTDRHAWSERSAEWLSEAAHGAACRQARRGAGAAGQRPVCAGRKEPHLCTSPASPST